jgi:addiction module HigA family antidote
MKNVPTIHPGEVLRKQFLTPRGISRSALARAAGMSTVLINDIVLGRRDVTVDTDARLAAALGTDKCFWLELQAEFDLEKACRVRGSSVMQS